MRNRRPHRLTPARSREVSRQPRHLPRRTGLQSFPLGALDTTFLKNSCEYRKRRNAHCDAEKENKWGASDFVRGKARAKGMGQQSANGKRLALYPPR